MFSGILTKNTVSLIFLLVAFVCVLLPLLNIKGIPFLYGKHHSDPLHCSNNDDCMIQSSFSIIILICIAIVVCFKAHIMSNFVKMVKDFLFQFSPDLKRMFIGECVFIALAVVMAISSLVYNGLQTDIVNDSSFQADQSVGYLLHAAALFSLIVVFVIDCHSATEVVNRSSDFIADNTDKVSQFSHAAMDDVDKITAHGFRPVTNVVRNVSRLPGRVIRGASRMTGRVMSKFRRPSAKVQPRRSSSGGKRRPSVRRSGSGTRRSSGTRRRSGSSGRRSSRR